MIRSLIFALTFSIAAADGKPPLDAGSYNQWKDALKSTTATPAGEVRALPGFRVELLRSAQAGEGSWVALAFDGKGRPVISREDKGLLRLTLPAKPGDPVPAELVEDTLLEVRGLICEGDTIIANANNSRLLVKLRDMDGDGKYEERTTLMEAPGGVGHGRNQIARHPGGALWVMGGDDVKLPAGDVTKLFANFGEDRLFTAPWDRFHWSNSVQPPCGHVMVLGQNGGPQLCCGGLRNPFGIAFNEEGEAFTYDADMEWDIGLPWYRPTRVIHLVSGADYGWRGASRPMPAWMPDTWPAVCDIGKGSPTSIMFGTRSNFPRPWRDSLFIMDWAYGIIYAVHLTPKGSTYEGHSEVFLQGRPLNVTSLDFGQDGAMYFITGGRRTQSGLYRVTWTGELPGPKVKPADAEIVEQAKRRREQRHKLELLNPQQGLPAWSDEIEPGLRSPDPFVRKAARVALECLLHPPSSPSVLKDEKLYSVYMPEWRSRVDRALTLTLQLPPEGGTEVLLAVARVGGAEFQPAFHTFWLMLARREWERTPPPHFQATMLRALELSVLRQGKPDGGQRAAVIGFLNIMTPMPDLHAAEVFAWFGMSSTIGRFLDRCEHAATQEERLHYLFTLRHAKTGCTLEQRKSWIAAFRRESARAMGAHHLGVTLRYARAEFEAALTAEEKTALAADLATLDPAAVAVPAVAPRPFVKAWTQAELEPHLAAVVAATRDLKRGRELFKSQCAACHRYGAEGGVIGPDLTGIAGRFDRRTILESLLDPWRVVADPYRFATATLKTGEIVSGRVLGDDGTSLAIEVNPVEAGVARKVPRSEAVNMAFSSQMLPGLANSFSQDELLDLLAFMERGGQ